jgi:hypothetical protein
MVAVLLRAVPWPAVSGITALAIVGAFGIAWRGGAQALLAISFALLAGAAAFVLDEPASAVVDITPTGPGRRTAARALALLVPLGAGAGLVLAGALRAIALPWPTVGLALAGNVLLGFAIACVARRHIGEPGALASLAVAFVLIVPGLLPPVARHIHTFPTTAPHPQGLSSNACWWLVGCACLAAIAASVADLQPKRRPPH